MVAREARYLSGNDIGKTLTVRGITGTLEVLDADSFGIEVTLEVARVHCRDKQMTIVLDRDETIEITGKKAEDA